MYNYIIFDIDGTLLDTETAVLASLQQLVFEKLHKKLTFEELSFALGIPGKVTLNKLGIRDVEESNVKWNEYLKSYYKHIKIFDGIEETLHELGKRGAFKGIVTSKTKLEFEADFIPFGIGKFFDTIICADDTKEPKPSPEPLLKFIELSGADKTKAIYVGDTKYDMECAAKAGIDFALALWGAKSSEGIKAAYILESPKQILDLINNKAFD